MRIEPCSSCFQDLVSWIEKRSAVLLEALETIGSWCLEQGRNLVGYFHLRNFSIQDQTVAGLKERVLSLVGSPEKENFDPQIEAVRLATEELKNLQEQAQRASSIRIARDVNGLKLELVAAVTSCPDQDRWEIQLCRYVYLATKPQLHLRCPQAINQVIEEMSSHFEVNREEIALSQESSGRIEWKQSLRFYCKPNPGPVYGFGRDLKRAIPESP